MASVSYTHLDVYKRQAKEFLKGEEYTVIDAEEHQDLVEKYGVRQAPTFVVDDGQSPKIYVNASNIRKYVESSRQG